jgi:uncharacterized protein (TIGR02284 family)
MESKIYNMETTEITTTEVLNDLLKINNDRIEGYEKASEEANDVDLKTIFRTMADESRRYANQLSQLINAHGGDPVSGSTTTSGKIYRVWMDVKATFTGKDRKAILDSCEFGEDAAQAAYKNALASNELSAEARELIIAQQESLRDSHDMIKQFRDLQKIADKIVD